MIQNHIQEYRWPLALAVPCILIVYWVVERVAINYRLSRVTGVRASSFAGNPLTALWHFWLAAWMQANNRLFEYFDGVFSSADPSCPNCVEMTFAGRRMLMTREPEHIKTVLTSKFTHFGKGAQFHHAWYPFLGDSIFTTDGPIWHKSRTLIRPMFIKERVRNLDIFQRWSDVMVSKLPPSGQTVEIFDLFYRMALDVTTDFLLGQSVGSLENPDGEFGQAFTDVQRTQMLLSMLSPYQWLLPQGKYRKGIQIIEEFVRPFIEAALALGPEELEKLSKSDKEFTFLHNIALFSRDPKVIRDQIMSVLLAGRDATAATLSWTLYELSNYPAIWQKLRCVVLDKLGPTDAPTYEDLKDLTCLTHALNETLRLYPGVPYNIRTCLEDSTLPGQLGEPDIAVLKGDNVIYSTMVMQRRKDLYPPVSETFADPAMYSPDRWNHWTPKPWQFVPFGGGPRICIGQNFAMTQMAFTLVRLLQKYERIEYRGDWAAQFHKTEIVGRPGHGVAVALYEAKQQ